MSVVVVAVKYYVTAIILTVAICFALRIDNPALTFAVALAIGWIVDREKQRRAT